jgi:hypothetical protein
MSSSKPSHLLQVLKATLSQVESSTEWAQDDLAVTELKRILLARIADLELTSALAAQLPVTLDQPEAASVAALPQLEVVAPEEPAKEAGAPNQPDSVPPTAD